MNKYVLCIKETFANVVLQSILTIFYIICKHYLNTVISFVTAKSTTFGVNLSYNVALSLTVKCNSSN